MKCPQCWAEKAYRRKVTGRKGLLYSLLLLEPMKCHHCFHKFVVTWFQTIGKQVEPPPTRIVRAGGTKRPSYAAQYLAASNTESRP